MRRHWFAIASTLLLATSPARAERQSIAVRVADCDNAGEIRRIVGVELGDDLDDTASASATVSCIATRAVLRVDNLTRTLDLEAEMPKARPRLIALALVELIATSRSEASAAPAPRLDVRAPPPERDARAQLRVTALAGGLGFSSNTGVLAGGGIRVARDGALIGWLADVQAHHGRRGVSLGDVTTDTFDATAALSIHRMYSRVRGTFAAGVRGGAARLAGSSDQMTVQSGRFWAPWLGALALASIDVAITSRIDAALALEGGGVILPVGGLVNMRREVAIDGGWFGVHVGIGVSL